MATGNSNLSRVANDGEHVEDVINYLKDASYVLGDISAIAGSLKLYLEHQEPKFFRTTAYELADAIWRLANDAESISASQAEDIERKGIRQEAQHG